LRDFNLVVYKKKDGSISAIQRRIFETFSERYEVLGEISMSLDELKTLGFLDSLGSRSDEINALLKKIVQESVRIGKESEQKQLILLGFIVRGAFEKAAKLPLEKILDTEGLFSEKIAKLAEEIIKEGVAELPQALDWLNPALIQQTVKLAKEQFIFLMSIL